MKTKFKFVILAMLLYSSFTYSQTPLDSGMIDSAIVHVVEYTLTGEPIVGDTVLLTVVFHAKIDAPAHIGIIFDPILTPLDYEEGERYMLEELDLDSGEVYNRQYQLKVNYIGYSTLSFIAILDSTYFAYRTYSKNNISIYADDESGEILFKQDPDEDVTLNIFEEVIQGFGGTGGTHTFVIEGRVLFDDWACEGCGQQPKSKPTYPELRLWFYHPDYPVRLLHPISAENGYVEGVHYAIPDDDGYFSFEFQANGSIPEGTELWVLAGKYNEALNLTSGSDHLRVEMSRTPPDDLKFAKDEFSSIKVGVNPNLQVHEYTNNIIQLVFWDGHLIRNIKNARKYTIARFNDVLPFILPQVNVYDLHVNGTGGGTYSGSINMHDMRYTTIVHEYGHYVHDAMNSLNGILGTPDKYEGWARFFVHASMWWLNNYFDEPAPYYYLGDYPVELGPYSYNNGQRFYNLYGNWLNGNEGEYDKYCCFLWNVYDSYDDEGFMPDGFNGYNNDDVCLGETLWEKFYEHVDENESDEDFAQWLIDEYDGNEIQSSIEKIRDFIYDDNQQSPPPQRPAQIKQVTSGLYGDCNFHLNWESQSYPGTPVYRNYEEGYHLYHYNNGVWDLIETIDPGETHYSIYHSCEPQPPGDAFYKLSSFNSEGDSYNPPIWHFS